MSFLHPRRWPRLLFTLCVIFALYLIALACYTLWQIPPVLGKNAFEHVRQDAKAAVSRKQDGNVKNYKWVELRNINKQAYQAIVVSEDGRFYQHGGIDWNAIQQAAEKNWQRKTFSVGGSTITQQTVKNVYLSNERNLIRKYRELIGTYLLEHSLRKKEILEVYLNIIEFGPNIYGIQHAARYYFKKTPAELTAREGAFLAVLMPAPKKYFYSIYQAKRMNTRHNNKYQRILRDMMRQGYLTQTEYHSYANDTFYGASPLDKNTIESLNNLDEELDEDNNNEAAPTDALPSNSASPAPDSSPSENTTAVASDSLTPATSSDSISPETPAEIPIDVPEGQANTDTQLTDI